MTEHDPRATFQADQADAVTRDQTSWELSVRASQAQAMLVESQAIWASARGRFWRIMGTGLGWLYAAAILYLVLAAFGIGETPW